uniref:Uncharacterized protein n=1 Tax=Rhizophora mucronata TaxID=61149 RepID=A0A2P2IZE5_RHIMU
MADIFTLFWQYDINIPCGLIPKFVICLL